MIFGVRVDISIYVHRVSELENVNRQQDELLRGQSQQITRLQNNLEYVVAEKRQQEEMSQNFRIHIERQLSLRDQEIERLRNDLERNPKEDHEEIRAFQKTFHQLQNAIHDVRKYLDRLGNVSD